MIPLRISIVVLVLLLVLMHVAMKVPFSVTASTVLAPSLCPFLILLLSAFRLSKKFVLVVFVTVAIVLVIASIVVPVFIVILLLFSLLVLSGALLGKRFALGVALVLVILLAYVNIKIGWAWVVATRIELKLWTPGEVPVGFAVPSFGGYEVINPATGQGWKGVRLRPLSSDKAGIFLLISQGADSLEVRHDDISFTVKVPPGIGPDHVVAVSVAGRSVLALKARTEDFISGRRLKESGLFLCGAQGYREISEWLKDLVGDKILDAGITNMHIRVSSEGSYRLMVGWYYVVLGDQPLIREWIGAVCLSPDGEYVLRRGVGYFVMRGDVNEVLWEVPREVYSQGFPAESGPSRLGPGGAEILVVPDKPPFFYPPIRYIVRQGKKVSWRDVVVEGEDKVFPSDWHSSWTPDGVLVTLVEQFQH